jgi:hypothetical protein
MALEEFLLDLCLETGWFGLWGMLKIQLSQPNFWTESRCPTNMTVQWMLLDDLGRVFNGSMSVCRLVWVVGHV